MDERPRLITRALRELGRLALSIALFAVIVQAPASSGPLLSKCPSPHAISA
jgi:hypothetical protein